MASEQVNCVLLLKYEEKGLLCHCDLWVVLPSYMNQQWFSPRAVSTWAPDISACCREEAAHSRPTCASPPSTLPSVVPRNTGSGVPSKPQVLWRICVSMKISAGPAVQGSQRGSALPDHTAVLVEHLSHTFDFQRTKSGCLRKSDN